MIALDIAMMVFGALFLVVAYLVATKNTWFNVWGGKALSLFFEVRADGLVHATRLLNWLAVIGVAASFLVWPLLRIIQRLWP